jgi:hypothetical protein
MVSCLAAQEERQLFGGFLVEEMAAAILVTSFLNRTKTTNKVIWDSFVAPKLNSLLSVSARFDDVRALKCIRDTYTTGIFSFRFVARDDWAL